MKIIPKLLTFSIFFLALFTVSTSRIKASEGEFELANTVGDEYRCYAISVLLQTNQYNVVVTCRNLIYPADDKNSKYTLWSRNGNDVVKLGSLAMGKASFNTKTAFSQLFVTLETDDKAKEPSSRIVMRGNLRDIPFLESLTTPFPTATIRQTNNNNATLTPADTVDENADNSVAPLTTREKLLIGLKRSSVIAGVALLGLIGLIFVITRSRG